MAYSIQSASFNVTHELTLLDDPGSALAAAKRRVLSDLRTSRVWSDLIGNEIRVTSDERPSSLLRVVEFDYSEDTRGEHVAYREADSDDPLSW